MWQILRSPPDFVDSSHELIQSTTRTIILTLSGIYLLWHLVATVVWLPVLGVRIWLMTALVLPLCLIVLRLLPRRILAAQVIWLLGLAAAITLAIFLFQSREIAFLYSLLPLIAVVMIGWPAGLLVEGLVIALVWWLSHGLVGQPPVPAYGAAVIVGGLVTGLLGWASAHTLSTVAQWSFFSFTQAREHMDEAQRHRAQLATMLKDLDHAYYRLERANAALVAARKVAEEAERFKAEFVTNVSHELRTPLNLIVGFSEMIMTAPESYDGVELPGPYRGDVNAIYRSAQHLLALVDDVLDLARIEAGKIALAREEVDLTALAAEAADTVRDYIAAKGLELRVHVQRELSVDIPTQLAGRALFAFLALAALAALSNRARTFDALSLNGSRGTRGRRMHSRCFKLVHRRAQPRQRRERPLHAGARAHRGGSSCLGRAGRGRYRGVPGWPCRLRSSALR